MESATTFHSANPPLLSAGITAVTAVVPLAATDDHPQQVRRGHQPGGRQAVGGQSGAEAEHRPGALLAGGDQGDREGVLGDGGGDQREAPARMPSATSAAAAEAQNRRKDGGRLRSATAGAVTTTPFLWNG
ncbi:hypothetical protein GCM10010295_38840 [Streptomyces intermedius]